MTDMQDRLARALADRYEIREELGARGMARQAVSRNGGQAVGVWMTEVSTHPDGEQFVMIKPIEEQSARLVVVLNWFEELQRQSGAP